MLFNVMFCFIGCYSPRIIGKAFWWLESYKDQIGLLIQLGLLVATFFLIRVGFKQATAAIAQGKAANGQAKAAALQSMTAQTQLDLSVRQLYANLSSADAATRPILQINTPKFEDVKNRPERGVLCIISNCGLGPALDLAAYYGDNPNEAAGLYGEFVGVGGDKREHFDLERIENEKGHYPL